MSSPNSNRHQIVTLSPNRNILQKQLLTKHAGFAEKFAAAAKGPQPLPQGRKAPLRKKRKAGRSHPARLEARRESPADEKV